MEGSWIIPTISSVLLFCLIFAMSATVDVQHLKAQLKNIKAILTGLFLQFLVLPVIGFVVVKALNLDHPTGLALLVVTTSPGGSYSNWYVPILRNPRVVPDLTTNSHCRKF